MKVPLVELKGGGSYHDISGRDQLLVSLHGEMPNSNLAAMGGAGYCVLERADVGNAKIIKFMKGLGY